MLVIEQKQQISFVFIKIYLHYLYNWFLVELLIEKIKFFSTVVVKYFFATLLSVVLGIVKNNLV